MPKGVVALLGYWIRLKMKTRITQEIFFDTESSRRARGSLPCHPMTFVGMVDVVDVVDPPRNAKKWPLGLAHLIKFR